VKIAFQRRTDLALLALAVLGRTDPPRAGSDLAARIGTSVSFLPQVMAPLIQAGWVDSERGPGGGYRLTAAALRARLLDVVEVTEGSSADGVCVLRGGPCPGDPACPIHPVWVAARQVLINGFAQIPAVLVEEGIGP
jgi:Rrf2 family iron-sulfur cluster assembly transcriptional regulator